MILSVKCINSKYFIHISTGIAMFVIHEQQDDDSFKWNERLCDE